MCVAWVQAALHVHGCFNAKAQGKVHGMRNLHNNCAIFTSGGPIWATPDIWSSHFHAGYNGGKRKEHGIWNYKAEVSAQFAQIAQLRKQWTQSHRMTDGAHSQLAVGPIV